MGVNHQSVSIEMLLDDMPPMERFASGSVEVKREEGELGDNFLLEDLPYFVGSSNTLSLSREVSLSFDSADPLAREISLSFSLPLSREQSKCLTWGSRSASFSLEREASNVDFAQLIRNASVHDFLDNTCEEAPTWDEQPANADADFMTIANLDLPTPASSCHAPAAAVARDAAERPGVGAPRGSRRGQHVKGRPEMQQTARDGAVHWSRQLKVVRAAWAARAAQCPWFRERFQGQLELAAGRVKSKQECLLRTLHLAAADGLIAPADFGPGGFFGWARFDVLPTRAGEFRRAVEAMFLAGYSEGTVKETFRRAGLVPDRWQWGLAWEGVVPWLFNPKERH